MARLIEHETADILKDIVLREARTLQMKGDLEKADFICLEKLAKTFQILNADTRETLKAGLLGKMTVEELRAVIEDA